MVKVMPNCFVNENLSDDEKTLVRMEVCCRGCNNHQHLFKGKNYCILHFPKKDSKDSLSEFDFEFQAKLNNKNYHFEWVWFPKLILRGYCFEKIAYFNNAYFSDYTNFNHSEFLNDVDFNAAIFNVRVLFYGTKFHKRTVFSACEFNCDLISFENTQFHSLNNDFAVQFNKTKLKGEFHFQKSEVDGDADFSMAEFEKLAMFDGSKFKKQVKFHKAKFLMDASFSEAKFDLIADFGWTIFSRDTYFDGTEFNERVNFNSSLFALASDVFFRNTTFHRDADFRYVTFGGFITFESRRHKELFAENFVLDLRNARLETPEKISFISVVLCPNWFVGIDSRKFIFTDVTWRNVSNNFAKSNIKLELKTLENRKTINRKQLLKITCRQLAENAETNSRFEESSNLRRMAMETEWLEKKEQIWRWFYSIKLKPVNSLDIFRRSRDLFIHGLYRFTSSYGESWSRALFILFCLLTVFTIYFHSANFSICPKAAIESAGCIVRNLSWGEAAHQSLMTGALQNVENRKTLTDGEDFIILLEKILVPIQVALLALAIRRKFMR